MRRKGWWSHGILLTNFHWSYDDIYALNISKCIICQRSQPAKLTSAENECIKLIQAVLIRNDIVLRWLQDLSVEENFKYHMSNACYKSYAMKKTLDTILVELLNFLTSLFCMFLLFFFFIFLCISFLVMHYFPHNFFRDIFDNVK